MRTGIAKGVKNAESGPWTEQSQARWEGGLGEGWEEERDRRGKTLGWRKHCKTDSKVHMSHRNRKSGQMYNLEKHFAKLDAI